MRGPDPRTENEGPDPRTEADSSPADQEAGVILPRQVDRRSWLDGARGGDSAKRKATAEAGVIVTWTAKSKNKEESKRIPNYVLHKQKKNTKEF